jgi:imidazole glycerol-phosphate synthase subunit HisF
MRRKRRRSKQSIQRARELRQQMNPAERLLWSILRNRQIGVKFRRQNPIGPYVVDFYCAELKLVIELDGSRHDDPLIRQLDQQREAWLRRLGITTIRITNSDLEVNTKVVEREIAQEIEDLRSVPRRQ